MKVFLSVYEDGTKESCTDGEPDLSRNGQLGEADAAPSEASFLTVTARIPLLIATNAFCLCDML